MEGFRERISVASPPSAGIVRAGGDVAAAILAL